MKEDLTPRQQELLEMLLNGIPPKEIAYNLHITYNTFLFHQKELYRKLGVHSVHELFTKYKPANTTVPESGELVSQPSLQSEGSPLAARKKTLPVKWLVIFGIVSVVVGILFFILKPTEKAPVLNEGHSAVFNRWNTFTDEKGSSIHITVMYDDIIDDKLFVSYSMSGLLAVEGWSHAGMVLHPVPLTQQAMKRMNSFSFKVLGDGKPYRVNVPTTDTIVFDQDMDHYWIMFPTVNGQISTVTVNVEDLMQSGHGRQVPFIRNNIASMEFAIFKDIVTESPDPFHLKVWDIRIY